jgi:hypothetical protein
MHGGGVIFETHEDVFRLFLDVVVLTPPPIEESPLKPTGTARRCMKFPVAILPGSVKNEVAFFPAPPAGARSRQ